MSKAPDLPQDESDFLLKILQDEVDRSNQRATGVKLGYEKAGAQAHVHSALKKRQRVGLPMALKIYEHILGTSREEYLARRSGQPLPPQDVPFATIRAWATKTKAVARALEKYGTKITTIDLLRLHASPARQGEFEPEEIYRHIEQLRAGGVLDLGEEVSAADLDSGARAARAKAKPKT